MPTVCNAERCPLCGTPKDTLDGVTVCNLPTCGLPHACWDAVWQNRREIVAQKDKDIIDLNNLARRAGWGQGEIDTAACFEEENIALRDLILRVDRQVRVNHIASGCRDGDQVLLEVKRVASKIRSESIRPISVRQCVDLLLLTEFDNAAALTAHVEKWTDKERYDAATWAMQEHLSAQGIAGFVQEVLRPPHVVALGAHAELKARF